jgi:glucose/arabinose dehydrogenase
MISCLIVVVAIVALQFIAATVAQTTETTTAAATATGSSTEAASSWCDHCARPVVVASLPSTMCMCLFANVKTPRVLDFAPNGDLLIGSPREGTPGITDPGLGGVYILADDDRNGVADDETQSFLRGESSIHGILAHKGSLYYTTSSGVYRVPLVDGQRAAAVRTDGQLANNVRVAELGSERYTHTLAVEPGTDALFVSTGRYDTNRCAGADDPRLGAVLRIGGDQPLEGTVVVENCRNPMYLRCMPWACYTMELSGDGWGGQNGVEKLVRFSSKNATDPVNVGYPCCIRKGQREKDYAPASETCEQIDDSEFEFRLGDTPFQFDWDSGKNFPAPYTGSLFIAMHGSFQAWVGAGIQVLAWDDATNKPKAGQKPVQMMPGGFGRGGDLFKESADGGGRVSGLKFHPDGRLFVSDDRSGKVFWIAPKTLRRTGARVPPLTDTQSVATSSSSSFSIAVSVAAIGGLLTL